MKGMKTAIVLLGVLSLYGCGVSEKDDLIEYMNQVTKLDEYNGELQQYAELLEAQKDTITIESLEPIYKLFKDYKEVLSQITVPKTTKIRSIHNSYERFLSNAQKSFMLSPEPTENNIYKAGIALSRARKSVEGRIHLQLQTLLGVHGLQDQYPLKWPSAQTAG